MSPSHSRGVRFVGNTRHHRSALAPPVPRPGQELCPVCRNAVTPRQDGYLRMHNDLFGYRCYNRKRTRV